MTDKIIYTPAEFAKIFGREKTWTYRQLYDGKIDAITDYGRTMIPASQIARIEGHARRYKSKTKSVEKETALSLPQPCDLAVANQRVVSPEVRKSELVYHIRQKGMGSRAVQY